MKDLQRRLLYKAELAHTKDRRPSISDKDHCSNDE